MNSDTVKWRFKRFFPHFLYVSMFISPLKDENCSYTFAAVVNLVNAAQTAFNVKRIKIMQ